MPPAQDNPNGRICIPANWESGPAASYDDTPSCQVAAVLAEELYWHNEHPVVVPDELQYVDYRIQIQWSVDVREQASRALQVFVPDFSDHQVRVDAKGKRSSCPLKWSLEFATPRTWSGLEQCMNPWDFRLSAS